MYNSDKSLDETKYIETGNNTWERAYLSAKLFKKDFETLIENYKSIYHDARESDFITDSLLLYQRCLTNVRYIDDPGTGICDVESRVVGIDILDEIQTLINNNNIQRSQKRESAITNPSIDPSTYGIDHKKRKGLKITFNVIIDFLEQKKASIEENKGLTKNIPLRSFPEYLNGINAVEIAKGLKEEFSGMKGKEVALFIYGLKNNRLLKTDCVKRKQLHASIQLYFEEEMCSVKTINDYLDESYENERRRFTREEIRNVSARIGTIRNNIQ